MINRLFVVREDSTVEVMHDLPDSEIVNMIGSDYFPAVFRIANAGIEYALVNLDDGAVEWKTALCRSD